MAVNAIWPTSYTCRHRQDRDLSGNRADQRAGYAHWLDSKDCTDWWRAAQTDTGARLPKQQWLDRKRAEETEQIATWEHQAGMPPLDGSEKAAGWSRRARHTTIAGAYDALVTEACMSDEQWAAAAIETPARLITRASWWIDKRDTEPNDVPELVAAAQGAAAGVCENDV